MLKGCTDFVEINYYTSRFVRHESNRTKIMYDNYDALAVSEDKFFIKMNFTLTPQTYMKKSH